MKRKNSLYSVDMRHDIDKAEGGGGGGTVIKEVLWENSGDGNPQTIKLNAPVTNYDLIIGIAYSIYGQFCYASTIVPVDLIKEGTTDIGITNDVDYTHYIFTSHDTLTKRLTSKMVIKQIIGIKL